MNRSVDLGDILDTAAAARDYGYDDDVLMWTLFKWASPVTKQDIIEYAKELGQSEGYGEEARNRLFEWFDKYEDTA